MNIQVFPGLPVALEHEDVVILYIPVDQVTETAWIVSRLHHDGSENPQGVIVLFEGYGHPDG